MLGRRLFWHRPSRRRRPRRHLRRSDRRRCRTCSYAAEAIPLQARRRSQAACRRGRRPQGQAVRHQGEALRRGKSSFRCRGGTRAVAKGYRRDRGVGGGSSDGAAGRDRQVAPAVGERRPDDLAVGGRRGEVHATGDRLRGYIYGRFSVLIPWPRAHVGMVSESVVKFHVYRHFFIGSLLVDRLTSPAESDRTAATARSRISAGPTASPPVAST